ncbi:growth factor [Flammula alnicola]|nr:growth factor [Flammula alnicola]
MTASSSTQNKAPQGHMPPGMVMGPDGKPCKICTAFRNWSPAKANSSESDSNRPARTWPTAGSNKSASERGQKGSFAGFSALAGDEPPPGCPPDVEQLGRATWMFLHTTAAYYPEKPSPTQRANMLMLLRSLPVLYPCTWCAKDFGKNIEQTKPDVSGRVALSRWLCDRHNEVNEKLGKEKFDCAKVDERWKDGPPDGSCD